MMMHVAYIAPRLELWAGSLADNAAIIPGHVTSAYRACSYKGTESRHCNVGQTDGHSGQ
jgi:hypothetical protein